MENNIGTDELWELIGDEEDNFGLEESGILCSQEQSKFIHTLLSQLDMDLETFKLESTKDLTSKEASEFIEQLLEIKEDYRQERIAKDLEGIEDFESEEYDRFFRDMMGDDYE